MSVSWKETKGHGVEQTRKITATGEDPKGRDKRTNDGFRHKKVPIRFCLFVCLFHLHLICAGVGNLSLGKSSTEAVGPKTRFCTLTGMASAVGLLVPSKGGMVGIIGTGAVGTLTGAIGTIGASVGR